MLRQLESEDISLPSTGEKTNATEEENAWTILDSIGTIANWERGVYNIPLDINFLKICKVTIWN